MTDPQGGKIMVGLFFALLGVVTRSWSETKKRRLDAQVARRTRVEGAVVENLKFSGNEDSVSYRAVIAYRVDGSEHRFMSRRDTVGPWSIGERVALAYDPRLPSDVIEAELDDGLERKMQALTVIGGVGYALAAWMGLLK